MARIKYETDASQSVRAQQELTKAQEAYNRELEETPKKLTKAEKAAKRLAEQADPQERYNAKMRKLAEAVEKGNLPLDKAHTLAKRYQQQLDRTGESGQKAFGGQALANLASMAAGWLSVGSAVGFVRRALSEIEQQNQRVADSFASGLGAIGELQQISATPAEFQKNLGFARSLVARGIFNDIGTTSDFTFAATSAGFSDAEKEFLAGVGEKKQIRPEGLIGFGSSIRKVQNFFGGGISIEEAADKITAASGFTQANITQTAQATPLLADSAKRLGYDPNEVLALLVAAEEALPSIDEAKTAASQFLAQIEAKGLNQGDLLSTAAFIQGRIDAGETPNAVLGNIRAIRGFSALQTQRGEYNASLQAIRNAGGTLAGRDFINADPIAAAAAEKESATGRLQQLRESLTSEKELLLDALLSDIIANKGGGGFISVAENIRFGLADAGQSENRFFRDVLKENRASGGTQVSPALVTRLEQYLERIANNTAAPTSQQE